jgi:hypothetical protein
VFKDLQKKYGGSLRIRISDRMPAGYYALTQHWVIFGLMPAAGTYVEGPMFEAGSRARLWRVLDKDWKKRWADARDPD